MSLGTISTPMLTNSVYLALEELAWQMLYNIDYELVNNHRAEVKNWIDNLIIQALVKTNYYLPLYEEWKGMPGIAKAFRDSRIRAMFKHVIRACQ